MLPVLVAVDSAPPAEAVTVSCSTDHSSPTWFDGEASDGGGGTTYSTGAYANIAVRSGGFCSQPPTSPRSFYYAWVMTASQNSNWAQIGFIQSTPSSSIIHFSEYTYRGLDGLIHYQDKSGPAASVNTNYAYQVVDDTTCPCYRMYYNFTQLDHTSYNPATTWTFPLSLQFFGETGNRTDQQPGHSSTTTHYDDIETQVLGGNWQPYKPTASANDDGFLWGLNPTYSCGTGLTHFCLDIWGTQ